MAERSQRSTAAALLASVLLVTSCADQQESLIVLHSPAWPDDGTCVVDPDSDTALAQGVFDLAGSSPYMLPVVLQNQLLPQDTGSSSTGTDNGEMQLVSADVTLDIPQAPELVDMLRAQDERLVEFTVPLPTISIAPGERQGVLFEAISRSAAASLRDGLATLPEGSRPVVLVNVVFLARRTGNAVGKLGEVESREYSFPVQICEGCLLTCSTCANAQCPTDFSGVVGGVCGNTQDLAYAPAGCENPNGM